MLNDAGGHGGGEKDEREVASEFSSRLLCHDRGMSVHR